MTLSSELLELPDSPEAVLATFCERQWCDGLPIVPPTPERVEAMLGAVAADPAESLGLMPPLWREATLEKLAINSVMTGCLPCSIGHASELPTQGGPPPQPISRALPSAGLA